MTDFSAFEHSVPASAPAQPAKPTGKQILTASWAMLRQDRGLLALPFISAALGAIAAAVLFIPGWAIGNAVDPGRHLGVEAGLIAAGFAASVVAIYFQAALVIGANQRADGGAPTLGGVLRATLALSRPILAWAVVTTTVGMAVRAIEQRLGVVGKATGLLGGMAWAVATFLAVPVVVAQGLGPVAAVKASVGLVRGTWGTGLRTSLRFGFIAFALTAPPVLVLIVGGVMLIGGISGGAASMFTLGLLLVVVGGLTLFAVSAVLAAISSYARALIYRYASGQPVPGIPDEVLAGAFVPRRGRRR